MTSSAAFIGRIGGLAVALGIGAAIAGSRRHDAQEPALSLQSLQQRADGSGHP